MSLESKNGYKTKGNVVYDKSILLSVINLAAKEIDGVSSLSDNFGSAIKKWFSNNYYEGVKLTYDKDNLIVDVYLNVFYGYNVSEIAYRVQENIKNSLSAMIDIDINKINVHVLDVEFPKEEDWNNPSKRRGLFVCLMRCSYEQKNGKRSGF